MTARRTLTLTRPHAHSAPRHLLELARLYRHRAVPSLSSLVGAAKLVRGNERANDRAERSAGLV